MATPPVVSVNIPTYRQLPLARSCVASILAQTFSAFEVTLYDDGASDEYRDFVASLADPRVRYARNPERLGAMRNMFACITHGSGRYTMAFHEDDVMAPAYLETAVELLESRPDVGFVSPEAHEFDDVASFRGGGGPARVDILTSPAEFVRAVLGGVNPMFGSVLYRREAVADLAADHDAYATLVDRPFLLAILESWAAAIIREPLVGYRSHGAGDRDARHQAMTVEHIIALFRAYRSRLPQPLSAADRALFYRFTAYWLFALYDLTPPVTRPTLAWYLQRVWREGLYQPGWRGRWGLRLFARALTGARSWAAS